MVPPPTQIVPSASCETCTRPARPSAVPWRATYGARARGRCRSSHWRERGVQAPGHRVLGGRAVLGEERAHLEGLGRAVAGTGRRRRGRGRRSPGRAPARRRRSSSSTATQPGPLSAHCASTIVARSMPQHRRDRARRAPRRPGPTRTQRRRGEREPVAVRAAPRPARRRTPARSRRRAAARRRPRATRGTCRASDGRRTAARRTGVKMRTR